ncbi:hypothetical protein [Leucobacter soli]|uniref:hypothetical protein n=1 Tax=Leucobacter soli TaxID=2812850 RepID=UPI003622531F
MRSGGYRSIAPEDMNYDMLIENRWLIAGSPETVREQLRDSIEQLGTGRVILSFTTGVKPRWMVDKTLQLFSEQVLPHFRGRGRALVDEAPRAGYTNRLEYAVKRREDALRPPRSRTASWST